MMDEKTCKSVVRLLGQTYHIKGDIDQGRLELVAELLDKRMKDIAQKNFRLSPEMVAIITALNIADEFLRLQEDYEQLMQMIKDDH
jgi:cell division protein ZapA